MANHRHSHILGAILPSQRCDAYITAYCHAFIRDLTKAPTDDTNDTMPDVTDLSFPTPLVSVAWLASTLQESPATRPVRVIDASTYLPTAGRNAKSEYDAAHIPGAVFADLGWLSDANAPFPHTLLDAATFGARIGALGIGNDDRVVVYDGSGQNFSAPRLWWMLRSFGHRQVSVLDGGLTKWVADGNAVTSVVSEIVPKEFVAALDAACVRDLDAMRTNVESHAAQVVDARSPGRFEGTEVEPRAGVRGGHIPGSVNVHYATLVNADGTVRSASALRTMFTEAGLDLSQPIIASCGTGVTACAVVLALDIVGAADAAVFDGSWTEWGSSADTPVATGKA